MDYEFQWELLLEPDFWLLIREGLKITLLLSIISGILGLLLGTLLLVAREAPFEPFHGLKSSRFAFLANVRPLRGLVTAFIEFFRNTPLLIQLMFWYTGSAAIGLPLEVRSEFIVGCFGLTVYGGAYIAEDLRSGLRSIANQQFEAARAIGLNYRQSYTYVILPQVIRVVVPPLLSQLLNLLKNSTLVSVVAVAELLAVCRRIGEERGAMIEALFTATLLFIVMSLLFSAATNLYRHFVLERTKS